MAELLAIVFGGIVTFLTRATFLISTKLRPSDAIERYLPLVGPAVLGAIAIPGILAPRGALALVDTVPAVIAAVAGWLLWRLTKQMALALVGGLLLWWGILAVLVMLGVER